jgi:hypothetical protein
VKALAKKGGAKLLFAKARFLLSVRNKKAIDSVRIQGHYMLVFPKVLGEGGRDDLGARIFWRVLGLR